MFAKFDLKDFPIVIVTFEGKIVDDNDFNSFLNNWIELYLLQKQFIFIFDTSKLDIPSIIYCIKMSVFISKLRKMPIQYLNKSLIIINHTYISYMIDFMFSLQPPVAPVYITQESIEIIYHKIKSKINIFNYNFEDIAIIKNFYAKRPFLPFL